MSDVNDLPARVYESAFAISLNGNLDSARQLSHDTAIKNTGRARRSGVQWSYFPATGAQAAVSAAGSDIVLPAEVLVLCAMYPSETLVIATVEVDPKESA